MKSPAIIYSMNFIPSTLSLPTPSLRSLLPLLLLLFLRLYLAFYLHDGYNLSDKDSLLNLKSNIIRDLYKAVFNYELTKYQQPIRQRWLYELKAAKQYLKRYEIHKQFAQYFLEQLNG